jgi:hypothetical protein
VELNCSYASARLMFQDVTRYFRTETGSETTQTPICWILVPVHDSDQWVYFSDSFFSNLFLYSARFQILSEPMFLLMALSAFLNVESGSL